MKDNVHTIKRRGFRLWKSGKHWFTAGAVATSLIVVSSQSSASADEVTSSNTDTSSSFVIGTEKTTVETNANGGTTTTTTSPTTVVESLVTSTTTDTVSSSATVTTESGVPVTESTVKNDTETGIAATNLDKKVLEDSADKTAYNTNENSVKGEGDVTIDHSTVENAAKDAQSKGVNVVKDADVKAPTTFNADETAKTVNSVTDAETKKANELNSTATKYVEDKTAWEKVKADTIAFNNGVSKASNSAEEAYRNFVSTLDADTAAVVSKYKDAIIVKTEEVISSGDGTSVDAYQNYIRVLAEKEKLNKDRISEYLVKRTKYDVDVQKIKDVNENNKQRSQSADAENTRRSQSVVSHNESAKASAEAENTKRSQANKQSIDDEARKSTEVVEYNKSVTASAEAENAKRSQAAKQNSDDEARKSTEVAEYNKSVTASAEAENAKRSQAAKQGSDDEARKSTEVAEYNKSVTASAEAENARLSQSAAAENAKINSNKEALASANAEAQAYNRQVMESRGLTYTGDYAKDKATVDNYNANLSAHTTVSESNSAAWNAAVNNASNTLPAASNGYTPSGSSTFTKPVTLDNGVQVVGAGVLTSDGSSVLFKGTNIDESKIVNSVNWGNTALEPIDGGSIRTLTPGDNNDIWGNTYDYTTGGSSRYYVVQTLKWYKISGLITTMDGVSHDGYIMFQSDPSGLHPAYNGSEVAVWNSNGAINVVDGAATGSVNAKSDAVRTVISMDRPNNDDKSITWVSLMSDIDGGQYLDGDAGKVIGVGGGLATNSVTDKVASDENLGYTYGKNTSSNALNGFDSAPDGTVLLVQNGLYSNSLRNTPGGNSNAVARADFGSKSAVSKTIIKTETPTAISIKPISTDTTNPVSYTPVTPQLKTYTPGTPTPYTPVTPELKTYTPGTPTPYTPVTPDLKTYTPSTPTPYNPVNPELVEYVPVTFELEKVPENPTQPQLQLTTVNKPVDPKQKEIPKEPERPTVHYNLTTLETTTKISKSVNNLDGADINNKSVAKNSKNTFTLSAEPLSAGREKTTSISWSDYINDGLKLDLDTMTKDNANYKVSFDESTRLLTMVGNDKEIAQANADLTKQYSITKPKITFTTLNDGATYTNTAKMEWNGGSEKGGITTYSNKVVIHTPGKPTNPNDPNNPNGPGNEKIQPVKNNTDKSGKNINDKTLLQNDTNYYVAEWDLDQYINDASAKEAIAKGFGYIDNYQDDALQPVTSDFKIVDSKGNEVKGLTRYDVNSAKLSEQPEKVQQLIKDSGIDVSNFGDFFVWVADDSQAFYDTYVKTGTDVFFNLPMKVKEGFVGNYTNQTYQIDFGNGYYGNVVKNNIPNLVPHKDVIVDGKFADGSTVAYGQEFKYLLEGVKIPGNRGDILWQYDFDDDYDQTGDKFLGTYRVSASTSFKTSSEVTIESDTTFKEDVTLSDGTVVKAGQTVAKGSKVKVNKEYKLGDDLTEFTTMTHDEENGIVKITFKEDFLKSVTADSEFGANAALDVKRIAYGEFENTYFNTVNGVKYKSNTVRTNTPKPKDPTPPAPNTPETPTPTPVTPETPKPVNNPKEVLPETGESNSSAVAALGLGLLLASGGVMVAKRKGKEEK